MLSGALLGIGCWVARSAQSVAFGFSFELRRSFEDQVFLWNCFFGRPRFTFQFANYSVNIIHVLPGMCVLSSEHSALKIVFPFFRQLPDQAVAHAITTHLHVQEKHLPELQRGQAESVFLDHELPSSLISPNIRWHFFEVPEDESTT